MERLPVTATAKAPADNFVGDVYMNALAHSTETSVMNVLLVRFTPGARTNWHSHPEGQTLHVTDGVGLVGTRDGAVIRMRAGDTVYAPPGEEHWHGATSDNFMCHLAMYESPRDGSESPTWAEPVSDDDYQAANRQ